MQSTCFPRQQRFRRGAAIVQVVVMLSSLAAAGGDWLWGHVAEVRLDRQVQQYRQAGEPVTPADLNSPPIPDADNAAIDFLAAGKAIDTSTETFKAFDAINDFDAPFTAQELQVLRAFVRANQTAIDDVEAATHKHQVDWGVKFKSPMITVLLPHLNNVRGVANLLGASALVAHASGDDALSVRRIEQMLFLGRAVDDKPFMVTHLFAIGIDAIAASRAETIARDLHVGGANGVERKEVEALIAQLLDDSKEAKGLREAFLNERVSVIDTAHALLEGRISGNELGAPVSIRQLAGRWGAYVLKPLILDDARLLATYITGFVPEAAAPDFPAARAMEPAAPVEVKDYPLLHPFARIMMASYSRVVLTHFRRITDNRLAAVSLAARMYALDHQGAYPAKIDDLVPAYLQAVPRDPFASDKPLLYRNAGDDPIVYSVGEDGIDNSGSEEAAHPDPRHKVFHGRWNEKDAVLHLKTPSKRDEE